MNISHIALNSQGSTTYSQCLKQHWRSNMAYIIYTLWLHTGFSDTGRLQIWAKLEPHFSAQVEQPGMWQAMSAHYDLFGLNKPLTLNPCSVLHILTSPAITWPSHLATQLLLIHNHPWYTVCQRTSISHALPDCPRCLSNPVFILVCLPVPILKTICFLSPSALFYLVWSDLVF